MYKQKNTYGFTLVEVLVGIMIVSFVLIAGFQAFAAVGIGKVKLIDSTNIEKETFFFTQKLFEEIKKGGLIDYEEYFNRKAVGNTSYMSGHYALETGYGNFGAGGIIGTTTYGVGAGTGFYYCASPNGTSPVGGSMGTNGCMTSDFQRYGQYLLQHFDLNSNLDADLGDEDGDGKIIGDYDDEDLGEGPNVFASGTGVTELYLISADRKKRTLFRWSVRQDPFIDPLVYDCDLTTNPRIPTGSGCLGTVEFLKLDGKDWGFDHVEGSSDITEYDGLIDTWLINEDFSRGSIVVAGTGSENYRLPLFSDSINVANFEVFAYPNKDLNYAWKDDSASTNISPYVRLKLKLMPSWKTRKAIKGKVPEFDLSTTINLTEIYSR